MSASVLLSIQVGLPKTFGVEGAPNTMDRPWSTGFFKQPMTGPVRMGFTNLEGDGQADLRVHGGPEKAVLAYSADHYPAWREELRQPEFPYGAFGENLTISGLTEDTVCIGDTYSIGEALVQVSQPRQPCWKLARRWGMKTLPAQVVKTGRSGWYFRVLKEGNVAAGQPVVLFERPFPEWTIGQVNTIVYHLDEYRDAAARLAECPLLNHDWRMELSQSR